MISKIVSCFRRLWGLDRYDDIDDKLTRIERRLHEMRRLTQKLLRLQIERSQFQKDFFKEC